MRMKICLYVYLYNFLHDAFKTVMVMNLNIRTSQLSVLARVVLGWVTS
jgi:hypothetical protein